MGKDILETGIILVKLIAIFMLMVNLVPLLVWVERRGSAFIQNRLGPNRVGPLGLLQLAADAVKFAFKEQLIPNGASKFLFQAAPVISLIPAALGLAVIPHSAPVPIEAFEWLGQTWGPYTLQFQGVNMNIGVIFILGVSSLGAYGILAAGWGSGSKFSLLGALRASAQMISYELALGLSIVGILMIYGTFSLNEMMPLQQGALKFSLLGKEVVIGFLPNWGVFVQPIGALLFLVCAFAESNRLPFDMAESEAELVAGFHTEYGGFKMLLFFMGEYGHMMVASCLFSIFYLGGYNIPFVSEAAVLEWARGLTGSANLGSLLTMLVFFASLWARVLLLLWLFVWVRWTLPRFRYDRLMDLGWKTMLPWALVNTAITAIMIYLGHRG